MLLIERNDQLSMLGELFRNSREGRGRMAFLSGPVACGKTALLTAFGEHVTAAGGQSLRAVGSRTERGLHLGVIRQLFQTTQIPPELAAGVSALLKDSPGDQADAQVLHGIFEALLELAEAGPVVLAVDDVRYADPGSLGCLLYLARRLGATGLMMIFTDSSCLAAPYHRARAELVRLPFCSQLVIPPLSAAGVAHLVREILGRGVDGLAEEFFQITGGNPLLVQALLADQAADVRDAPILSVGDKFAHAIVDCLHRHDDTVRAVAQGLAVLAESGQPELVSRLLDLPPEVTAYASRLLEASGLVCADRFRHPHIQRAISGDTGPDELRRLHGRAADLLYRVGATPGAVAAHLVKADDSVPPWAVPVLRNAAERALLVGEPESASGCLRLAVEASADQQERIATAAMLVRAQWQLNPLAVTGQLGELAEMARAGSMPARQVFTVTPYLLWNGRTDDANDSLSRAASSPAMRDARIAVQFRAVEVLVSWVNGEQPADPGEPSHAAPAANAILSVNPELQAVTVLDKALNQAGATDICGAEQILQRCELEDAASGPVAAALAALVCAGRSDRAVIWSEVFLHRPSLRKAPTWHAILRAIRAEAALRVGDLVSAEDHARTALAAMPAQAWGAMIGLPLAAIMLAATETGNFSEAARCLTIPVPSAMLHTPLGLLYLRARGRYYLATGRYQAALSDFQSCAEVMRHRRLGHPVLVPWRLEVARAHVCLGDRHAAASLAREQLQDPDGLDGRTHGLALRLLAAAAVPNRRIALLKEAVDILQGCDDRVELAHTLADLGRAMEAQGDSGRARMMVTRAYQLANAFGAKLLCSSLLLDKPAICPADVFSPAPSGAVNRLSDAERRVASLAAQGRTNREIADKLFITVSTVEQHLTRVYKKLEIKRRVDLPIGLADHGDAWIAPAPDPRAHVADPQVPLPRRPGPLRRAVTVSYSGRA